MQKLTKEYIERCLMEENLWKIGEEDSFIYGDWHLILRREEDIYIPFKYSLKGKKSGVTVVGAYETWGRRYVSMESAFLHVLNSFNENAGIKNQYNTLNDALNRREPF